MYSSPSSPASSIERVHLNRRPDISFGATGIDWLFPPSPAPPHVIMWDPTALAAVAPRRCCFNFCRPFRRSRQCLTCQGNPSC